MNVSKALYSWLETQLSTHRKELENSLKVAEQLRANIQVLEAALDVADNGPRKPESTPVKLRELIGFEDSDGDFWHAIPGTEPQEYDLQYQWTFVDDESGSFSLAYSGLTEAGISDLLNGTVRPVKWVWTTES